MLEVEDDILSEVVGCEGYHKKAPQYGERAWIAEGKKVNVVYWDTGNGWCDILLAIPKECRKCGKKLEKLYEGLQKAIAKHYDENMYRID